MGFRLFFIGIILSALLGAGAYVMKLQKDNVILKENAVKLESAIAAQAAILASGLKNKTTTPKPINTPPCKDVNSLTLPVIKLNICFLLFFIVLNEITMLSF